jgi:uncharacterized membrane protein
MYVGKAIKFFHTVPICTTCFNPELGPLQVLFTIKFKIKIKMEKIKAGNLPPT